ncbi:MAG: ABC transporter permease [Armatimonadota bacterium]|nr:ABC transporter permease [Armatimonadota bacterium]MDR7456008.1 ABC transporter permease [Armatimonadota bacterium]MDR7495955.1 ABC transporter permease [Armatimonadota bacterium]MDR7511283.1 ABC transporter permease [Armatimonadota bacterium]
MLTLVPYVLASQGTMLAGRAGIFNVSQEGIMLAGASVGFLGAYLSGGNLLQGLVLATVTGALFGLALAYFTTTLKMDQFVVGLALFFIGLAISTLLYRLAVGVTLTPPLIPTLREIALPGLSHIPVVGEIVFRQNVLVYGAIVLSLILYLFLYTSGPGLALRAVGEHPMAADSLGVNVPVVRYVATVVGGMLIGLAGAYLPMVYTATFTDGIVRGRGWLSIALTFFGGWSPHLIFFGALFFAAVEVLAFRVQVTGIGVPYQVILMLPYLATMAVMMPTFRRLQIPAFLGKNYDRERRMLL